MAPVWNGETFVPRLMLRSVFLRSPCIDGAAAARSWHLATVLEDAAARPLTDMNGKDDDRPIKVPDITISRTCR
jgi:hypothetical protein